MAAAEHQVDLGRPGPDAFQAGQRRDRSVRRHLRHFVEAERATEIGLCRRFGFPLRPVWAETFLAVLGCGLFALAGLDVLIHQAQLFSQFFGHKTLLHLRSNQLLKTVQHLLLKLGKLGRIVG